MSKTLLTARTRGATPFTPTPAQSHAPASIAIATGSLLKSAHATRHPLGSSSGTAATVGLFSNTNTHPSGTFTLPNSAVASIITQPPDSIPSEQCRHRASRPPTGSSRPTRLRPAPFPVQRQLRQFCLQRFFRRHRARADVELAGRFAA